jgi:hypothetical protein
MIEAFKDIQMHDLMPSDYVESAEDANVSEGLVQGLRMNFAAPDGVDADKYDFQLSLNDPNLGFLGF